jgi:tape measure domain-containing protein
MATIGTLVVNLTLNNTQFIAQMNRAAQTTARATQQMRGQLTNLERNLHRVGRAFGAFITVGLLARGVKEVASYADAWKLATNQVAAANAISNIQARSMEGINEIASRTRTSLSETAELYGKLLRSTNDVATSEKQVALATELVNKAFKAGGASVQEQVNGIRQLAQSLASGIFQGDELRSIRENAPLLAQAIADEFNTTIGGLKKLGAEGALTADRVFRAILAGAKPIEDAFAATNATIADSFTILSNALVQYVGKADAAFGISKGIAETAKLASANFQELADSIFSSNGEIERLIKNWKALRDAMNFRVFDEGTDEAEQLAKVINFLKETVISSENPLGNFSNRVLGGLSHPFNAFIKQINGAVEGWNFFKTEISKLPTVGEFAEFLGLGELRDEIAEIVTGVTKGFPQYLIDIGKSAMQAEGQVKRMANTVETFGASQSRGRPAGTFEFLSAFLKDRGGRGFSIPAETQETLNKQNAAIAKWRAELQGGAGDMDKLAAAAANGSKALDRATIEIEAYDAVLELLKESGAKVINMHSEHAKWLMQVYISAKLAGDANRLLADIFDETTSTQRQIDQNKQLTAALRGSAEEFDRLRIKIEAYNYVVALGGDGTTEFEKGLMKLKEEAIRSGEVFERTKDQVAQVGETINSTIGSAISSVSSAFADAVVEGENFRDMLDALLKDLAKLAINSMMQLFLRQIIGGVGVTGGAPGTGLLSGIAVHEGGIVGREGTPRTLPSSMFAGAPRFHGGLRANEYPAILEKGEGVFTSEQMKALGGGTTNNFTVINQVPNTRADEDRRSNSSGGTDVTVFIRQAVSKEVADPASSVHKSLKSTFGLSQATSRR